MDDRETNRQGRTFELETLLAETEWVGGLALGLVGDLHRAEDLVQEAWLAALRRPPRRKDRAESPRPWLATVVRNAARMVGRSDGARRDREALRAAVDAGRVGSSPEELVARLESQELVSRLVRELPADLADVVLLSFFEGKTSEEIAALRGVPAGTVRSRKKRALELLRERLDGHHDGDRSAWLAGLAPVAVTWSRRGGKAAASGGALAATLTPIAMMLTWKSAAATAAVVLTLFALTRLGGDGADAPRLPSGGLVPGPAHATLDEPRIAAGTVVAVEREAVDPVGPGDPGAPALAAPAAAAPPTKVRLQVVDHLGAPVPGATVRAVPGLELAESHQPKLADLLDLVGLASRLEQTTDGAGVARYETDFLDSAGLVDFDVVGPRFGTGTLSAVVEPGVAVDLGTVVLRPGGAVTGRVRMADGSEPDLHLVELADAGLPADAAGLAALRSHGPEEVVASLRAEGSVPLEFVGIAPGSYRLYRSPIAYGTCQWSEPFTIAAGQHVEGVELVLDPTTSTQTRIQVLGADGAPLATARVDVSRDGFRIDEGVRDDGTWGFGKTFGRFAGGRLVVSDTSLVHRTTVVDPLPLQPESLTVRLERATTVERALRIVDGSGAAVPGAFVRVVGAHGTMDREGYDGEEPLLLPGPTEGPFDLVVRADGHREARVEGLAADALPEDWTVALEALPGIRGRVLVAGEPAARVQVHLWYPTRPGTVQVKGDAVSHLVSEAATTRTDGDGVFHLHHEYDGRLVVVAEGRGGRAAWLELDDFRADDGQADLTLELQEPGELRGVVRDHTGQPVPRQALVLNHPILGVERRTARADGSFHLRRVPAGDWLLRAVEDHDEGFWGSRTETPEGWTYPANRIVAPGAEVVADLVLADPGGSRLAGRVELLGGDPGPLTLEVEAARGTVFAGDPFAEPWSRELALAGDGSFDLEVAAGRAYDLTLTTAEPSLRLWATVPATDLPAILDSELGFARLELRVPGWLAAGAGRDWVGIDWDGAPWRTYQRVTPGDDGSLREVLVPAGRLELTWREHGDADWRSLTVHLDPGEERVMPLD